MKLAFAVLSMGLGVSALVPTPVLAFPIMPIPGLAPPAELVAGGCGPGRWRGPWGHCRSTPYVGPLPGGWYQTRGGGGGCPTGYWRGPWGHCRNTPYHGRLPGGGWK